MYYPDTKLSIKLKVISYTKTFVSHTLSQNSFFLRLSKVVKYVVSEFNYQKFKIT